MATVPIADIGYLVAAPLMLWFGGGVIFAQLWSIPALASNVLNLPTPWDAWRLLLSPLGLSLYNLVTYVGLSIGFLGAFPRGPAILITTWLVVGAAYRYVRVHALRPGPEACAPVAQQAPSRANARLALLLASVVPVALATISTVRMLAELLLAG
jgi:hypothetical protein